MAVKLPDNSALVGRTFHFQQLDRDNTDARVILVAALTASNRSEETLPVVAKLRRNAPTTRVHDDNDFPRRNELRSVYCSRAAPS